jgi:tetraacyldisaccharide 4'-kinase
VSALLARRIEASWTAQPGQAGLPPGLGLLLKLLALIFLALTRLRQALYRLGLLKSLRLPVRTVVVGNRIVGGAGKTPTTIALASRLKAAGWQVGIVSRGYGRNPHADLPDPCPVDTNSPAAWVGDEPLLMRLRTGCQVWVGRDRVAAARALLAAHPQVDLILCDDGLQHLRLGRDLEVIVFDERGAGNGWLLPAGPLREAVGNAATPRPGQPIRLVLYNAPAPTTSLPGWTARRRFACPVPLALWWQGPSAATSDPPACLRHEALLACAGLGQPQRFFETVAGLGLGAPLATLALPDHARFDTWPWTAEHLRTAQGQPIRQLILTEKDAVKIAPDRLARDWPGLQVWVLPMSLDPDPEFLDAVEAAVARNDSQDRITSHGHPTA